MEQNKEELTAKGCQAVMKYIFLKGNSAKKKIITMMYIGCIRRHAQLLYHTQELGYFC
jgi:hypothetical protein